MRTNPVERREPAGSAPASVEVEMKAKTGAPELRVYHFGLESLFMIGIA